VGTEVVPNAGLAARPLFSILIPHTILAMVNLPFILAAVWFAITGKFESHKRITRWLWPSWMFVSITRGGE
jgi:putative membrane protein